MEQILDILLGLVASILGIYAGYLTKKVANYFDAKLSNEEQAKLESTIKNFVAAAEQMYGADDPDGSVRLDYVQGLLVEAGYELTDAVRAVIESQVNSLNANKK